MAEKKVGLKEFAQTRQSRPAKCWICSLPEKEEIDEALRAGISGGADTADWLITKQGYNVGADIMAQRVRRHRKNCL